MFNIKLTPPPSKEKKRTAIPKKTSKQNKTESQIKKKRYNAC